MELDELYALLTLGAIAPYVAEATVSWVRRSGCSKSVAIFLQNPFNHLPN
ncbi:hypothetical protein [Propionivibrio soli]|nr:hypothetical protein [Propionivibrio soli]